MKDKSCKLDLQDSSKERTSRFLQVLYAMAFVIGINAWSAAYGQSSSVGSEWYFSWGYSRNFWAPSDIHISQPSLGNKFTVHKVKATDFPQWDTGLLNKGLTIPQWNLRIGRFIGTAKNYALEFNIDHSKYTSIANQSVRISGMINHQPIDEWQKLTDDSFRYRLHNGANHIMMNFVRRISIVGAGHHSHNLDFLIKCSAGIMLPHASNTILGKKNDLGSKSWDNAVGTHSGWWRLNGWTAGVEAALRWTLPLPYYLEFSGKTAYSELTGVPVYKGEADQNLLMNEWVLSVGYTLQRE